MNRYINEILFTREQIENKCKELAKWVNSEFADSKNFIIIGLLKGSVPFLAQLMKDIKVLHKIDFMTVSSFGGETQSSGNLKIIMDLKTDILDKDILIVEDIVDSGVTLSNITRHLKMRKPAKMKTLTLLDKKIGRKMHFEVDKFGFEVPDKFLVGFGLDIREKLRNLPYIGVFNKGMINEL